MTVTCHRVMLASTSAPGRVDSCTRPDIRRASKEHHRVSRCFTAIQLNPHRDDAHVRPPPGAIKTSRDNSTVATSRMRDTATAKNRLLERVLGFRTFPDIRAVISICLSRRVLTMAGIPLASAPRVCADACRGRSPPE